MLLRSSAAALAAALVAFAFTLPEAASAAPELESTLTIEVEGEGEVECKVGTAPADLCEELYPDGTTVTLLPVPGEGSEFLGWSAGTGSAAVCTGTTGSCTVEIEADSFVTATFEPVPEYSLDIETEGEGEVECNPAGDGEPEPEFCEAEYPAGTKVALVPVVYNEEESRFAGWSEATGSAEVCPGKTGSCTITIEEDSSVTAIFNLKEFPLHIFKGGTGTGKVVCEREEGPEECQKKYSYGTVVYLTAVAADGSAFAGWSGDCHRPIKNGECEVEIEEASEATATFEKTGFALTVTTEGTGTGTVTSSPAGIECGSTCSGWFGVGSAVTLTALADSGSSFAHWSGACSGAGTCEVTMGKARTVKAVFAAVATEPGSTSPPSSPPVDVAGTARAARLAYVRGRTVALRLACFRGPCGGRLKLSARVRQGRRTVSRIIGTRSFSLAAGASSSLRIRLSGAVARELASGRTMKARVRGPGVEVSTVRLKSARRAKKIP